MAKPAKFKQTLICNSLLIRGETHVLQYAVLQRYQKVKIIQCKQREKIRILLTTYFVTVKLTRRSRSCVHCSVFLYVFCRQYIIFSGNKIDIYVRIFCHYIRLRNNQLQKSANNLKLTQKSQKIQSRLIFVAFTYY